MKMDIDLVRKILLNIEAEKSGFSYEPLQNKGYSIEEINNHLLLLFDEEWIVGRTAYISGQQTPLIDVERMTMKGHEFLNACRDDTLWMRIKRKLADIGQELPLDTIKQIAVSIFTQYILKGGS